MFNPDEKADTPVFGRSKVGSRVSAERRDCAGNEETWRKAAEADNLDQEDRVVDPMADLLGDWSWKPDRYVPDPGRVWSAAEVAALNTERGLA